MVCDKEVCDKVVCDREAAAEEDEEEREEERDTESKTRTPHKDVGKKTLWHLRRRETYLYRHTVHVS